MGFFNKLFGENNTNKEDQPKSFWMYLEETPLDEIVKISFEKPVAIFKHSTRCSISRFALKQFEMEYDFSNEELQPYFLDLLEYRSISNEVASRFNVFHQSPQILLIKEGKSVYDASHDAITVSEVRNLIN